MKQSIVTLDFEGVLVPEIWIAVAERNGGCVRVEVA